MRYMVFTVVAILAATFLMPVVAKCGVWLGNQFKEIWDAKQAEWRDRSNRVGDNTREPKLVDRRSHRQLEDKEPLQPPIQQSGTERTTILEAERYADKLLRETVAEQTEKGEGGFTLIELMIIVAIIAILAAVALPAYKENQEQQESTTKSVERHETVTRP